MTGVPGLSSAAAPSSSAAPDECSHPAPVEAVLAHEFAHYDRAHGPEGLRRTVTHYGPVIGGMAIAAWHCESCGLLKVHYPDGRREERQLFPGPQPGLLVLPAELDPNAEWHGRQAQVSGLSMSRDLVPLFAAKYPPLLPLRWPWTLPDLEVTDWLSVIGLGVVLIGLLLAGILAIYDTQTSPYETMVIGVTAIAFAVVVLLQIVRAAANHFFGIAGISPHVSDSERGRPAMDAVTRTVVGLLGFCGFGLVLAGILATYDYQTSSLEGLVVILTSIAFALALLVAIGAAAVKHFGAVDDIADVRD